MKRISRFLWIPCLVLMTLALAPSAHAMSGLGTETNPYIITSAADLNAMHNNLSAYYALGADIDVKGVKLTPVGNELEGAFTGSLDGRGHTIYNLSMNFPDNKFVGLFGYIEGIVKNIFMSDISLTGGRCVGAIAGNAGENSTIINCSITSGVVSSKGAPISVYMGGIVGLSEGDISLCSNSAKIVFNNQVYGIKYCVGGIIGYFEGEKGVLDQCNNNGDVFFEGSHYYCNTYYGGIVGYVKSKITLQRCNNTGKVSSTLANSGVTEVCGGLIGCAAQSVEIANCNNQGAVYDRNGTAGGLLGLGSTDVVLTDCNNSSEIVGNKLTGGMVAKADTLSLLNCTNSGNVSTSGNGSGGMVGVVDNSAMLTNCKNSGKVSALNNSGGMIGYSSGSTVTLTNCTNSGSISSYSGGMIGGYRVGDSLSCLGCVNLGNVGTGDVGIGGIVSIVSYKYGNNNGILSISPMGVSLRGKTKVYCSDLRYNSIYLSGAGYSLADLQDKNSAAYDGWNFDEDWTITPNQNSGLPMPAGYNVDYMDKSVLFMQVGEKETVHPPFIAQSWGVDGDAVVTVTSGTVTAAKVGATCVSAYGPDGRRSNCIVYVYDKKSSVSLSQTNAAISVNGSVTLTTNVPDTDPQGIIWSSSDESIATVAQTGQVTGKKPGTATITATLPLSNNVSASCQVKVNGSAITSLSLTNTTVNVGSAVSINRSISPSSNFENNIVWKTSDESVVVVDQTGKVTGIAPGAATITATAGSVSGSCTVTVKQPAVEVTLNKSALTLERGLTEQLTAAMSPANTTDTLSWSSTNTSVVTVSNGLVTAKSVGQASIVVKASSGATDSCIVTVGAVPILPTAVTLNHKLIAPTVGEKVQLTATVMPSGATDKSVIWASSDPSVASVSASGVVEAIASGTAEITATSVNGYYDVCRVKVPVNSSAAFVLSDGRVNTGNEAESGVYLTKNPGVSAFTVQVTYNPSMLTPVAVESGDILKSGTLSSNVERAAEDGTLYVTWYSAEDVTENGLGFTIRWQASDRTGTVPISLTFDQGDISNSNKAEVGFTVEDGQMNVIDYLIGDIYQDSAVNMKDIVYFARWFNHMEEMDSEQTLAADVYYDNTVDTKDLTELAQILSRGLNAGTGDTVSGLSLMGAGEAFTITVSDGKADQSGNVTVAVTGADCPGVSAFRFVINAPAGYEIVEVLPGGDLPVQDRFSYNPESRIVTWYQDEDAELDGTIFTIRLHSDAPHAGVVTLDYAPEDFFSAQDYREVPVMLQAGNITLPTVIRNAKITDDGISFDLQNGRTGQCNLVAAFYADGKMLSSKTKTIQMTEGKHTISIFIPNGWTQCKLFLTNPETFAPLCENAVLDSSNEKANN